MSSIIERDELGRVLGEIRIVGEHRGDRLADIAHNSLRQHLLAVGLQLRQPGRAKSDRRDCATSIAVHTACTPGSVSASSTSITDQPAVRDRRAHHAHVQLAREGDVGGEPAAAGQQRPIFEREPSGRRICRRPSLPRISSRRRAHGLDDVLVAGAAAEIGRQHVEQVVVADVRLASSTPTASIKKPGVQKPHCRP